MKYLAQKICVGNPPQCIDGPLPAGTNTIGAVINNIMTFLVPFAAIILLFVLIWGGFDYMTSQGNPEKIKSASAKMTSGLVGMILLLLSFLVVKVISTIFGLGQGIF